MSKESLRLRQDKHITPQNDEQSFLDGITRLRRSGAAEIANRWQMRYDQLADSRVEEKGFQDLFSEFATFTDKREAALFSMEIPEDLDDRLLSEIREFDRNVILSFKNASLFQGNGATAEVYEVLGHPNICVKFITNQNAYNENNHIRTEFGLLGAVSSLRSGRVRAPVPYFLRIHPREGHSFGMEKIDGRSLSQILENPHENPDLIAIAKTVDRERILAELKQYVLQMHEIGITHNDLRKRNLMLDRSGNFFVIDFGKAKKELTDAQRDMFEESDLTSIQSEIRSFFDEIDKLKD